MNSTKAQMLDEDQAIELLAFMVTAARIQLDEPASYGPMRLLMAAERLSSFMEENASPGTQAFLGRFMAEIAAAQDQKVNSEHYPAALDGLCRGIAELLVARSESKGGPK